jgi:hypothetical protein
MYQSVENARCIVKSFSVGKRNVVMMDRPLSQVGQGASTPCFATGHIALLARGERQL